MTTTELPELAEPYGPEIVARLTRETGAKVPIVWDPDGAPRGGYLEVHVMAFPGCLHVNAYDGGNILGPDLLPLTDRGLGQSVPWGDREPGTDGWVDDIWPALSEVVTRAVRLVEAHAAEDVCTARIGYADQAAEGRFPYRCRLATHDPASPHQHSRHRWVGQTAPVDGNGPMVCAPVEED